jgi:hypothetical protein
MPIKVGIPLQTTDRVIILLLTGSGMRFSALVRGRSGLFITTGGRFLAAGLFALGLAVSGSNGKGLRGSSVMRSVQENML